MKRSDVNPAVPARHGIDLPRSRVIAGSLRRFIREDPTPDAQQWRAIGQALQQGDPLADGVVAWFDEVGAKHGLEAFRAINDGHQRLDTSTPVALRLLFDATDTPPQWLCWDSISHGARVFHRAGGAAYMVLRNLSLMGGYRAAGLNPPLLMTGSLEGGTARRIAQTMKWVMDCTERDGLRQGGVGHRSTLHVRLVHALIRRKLQQRPEWDSALLGLPINQADMALTYLGFGVMQLLGLRFMGMPLSAQDVRGVMHLWSYACWLMGVDPRWLREGEQEGRALMYQLVLSQMPPDASSKRLGRALMRNTMSLPFASPRAARQRLERAKHLSTTRLFVGAQGMAELGLPAGTLPWYPVITALPRMAKHLAHRRSAAATERLERAGRQKQEALLTLHFGGDAPGLVEHPV